MNLVHTHIQAPSKVHNAIHSSPTVNEYPQQTPQNPQVLGTCPGYISGSSHQYTGPELLILLLLQKFLEDLELSRSKQEHIMT